MRIEDIWVSTKCKQSLFLITRAVCIDACWGFCVDITINKRAHNLTSHNGKHCISILSKAIILSYPKNFLKSPEMNPVSFVSVSSSAEYSTIFSRASLDSFLGI